MKRREWDDPAFFLAYPYMAALVVVFLPPHYAALLVAALVTGHPAALPLAWTVADALQHPATISVVSNLPLLLLQARWPHPAWNFLHAAKAWQSHMSYTGDTQK